MPRNNSRHQKKLMKKRQKDKQRKKMQKRSISFELVSPKKKIHLARNLPFYECLINPTWKDDGLANILISRQQTNGNIAFGLFMVDIFCLGLKNTFCNVDFSARKYKIDLRDKTYEDCSPIECPIPLAHNIIYKGIEYARQFGFEPQKDFKLSQYITY